MRLLLALSLLAALARAQEPTQPTFKVKLQDVHAKGYLHSEKLKGVKRSDPFRNMPRVKMPNRVDLRAIGKGLSQIEDQGRAGNCWAFALVSTLRDTWIRLGKDPGRISVQYLVDASARLGMGCWGGDYDAAQFLEHPRGAPSWDSYPYSDRRCNGPLKRSVPKAAMANLVMVQPSHYNLMYVMHVLKRPLIIVVAAEAGMWEYYDGGTYNACRGGQVDHMIAMVGLDREGADFMANGNLPNGRGVGILRNHWGSQWGEAGWMNTKLTDSQGNPCNEVAVEAGYLEVGTTPRPK